MSTIQKVCTRVPLRQQKSDFAYSQTQSYQARLAALEAIRREYHLWKYHAEPRLQRVCTIVVTAYPLPGLVLAGPVCRPLTPPPGPPPLSRRAGEGRG